MEANFVRILTNVQLILLCVAKISNVSIQKVASIALANRDTKLLVKAVLILTSVQKVPLVRQKAHVLTPKEAITVSVKPASKAIYALISTNALQILLLAMKMLSVQIL